jgi:hypothetical protein
MKCTSTVLQIASFFFLFLDKSRVLWRWRRCWLGELTAFLFCECVSVEQIFFVSMCFIFRPRNVEPAQKSSLTCLFCWKELCANVHGERQCCCWCDCMALEVIFTDYASPPSKNEIEWSGFPIQCIVDVHKTELYAWINQIIADNSERHVCVSVQWRCLAFVCFCNRRRQYCFTYASKQEKSNSEGGNWSICF